MPAADSSDASHPFRVKPATGILGRRWDPGWKTIDRLIGLAKDEGGPTDVAEKHDEYLYGGLRPR